MFPNRAPVPPGSGSSYKLSIPETCDRIKEEFSYFQQQTHNFHVEREKIIQERSEMQRLCIMYYEMAHGLNLEMHRQMEIAKRLNAILNQLIPYLSQEHQSQITSAIDRAKQVTMQELNSAMMHTEEAKCSKFFNGGNFGFPDQLEFYKHMLNAAATLNPSGSGGGGNNSAVTSQGSTSVGFPLPGGGGAPLMSNSMGGNSSSVGQTGSTSSAGISVSASLAGINSNSGGPPSHIPPPSSHGGPPSLSQSSSSSSQVPTIPPPLPPPPPPPPPPGVVSGNNPAAAAASSLAAGAANFFANLMASGTTGGFTGGGQNPLSSAAALANNPAAAAAANFFLNASAGGTGAAGVGQPNSLNYASALLKQEADKHMNDEKQKNSSFSRPPSANDKIQSFSNHISEVHEKRRKLDIKAEHKDNDDDHFDDKRCNTFNGNGKLKDHEWRHSDNLPISPRSVGSSTPGLNKKKMNKNALDLSQGPGANLSHDGYPTTCSAPATPATGSSLPLGSRPDSNNINLSKSKNHSKSYSQSTKKHYNYVVKSNGQVEPRLMPIDSMTGGTGNMMQYPQQLRHLASFSHGEVVCAVAMHHNIVYSGGKGTLKLWDVNEATAASMRHSTTSGSNASSNSPVTATRDPLASLSCLNSDSYIRSIKLINGVAAVIGGETNIVDIWDMAAGGTPIKKGEVKIDAPACYALTVAPDGKTCFSCFSDGNIAMIDIHNQTVVNQFQAHAEGASCIEISYDGTYLWTGGLDSVVRAWDIRDCGRELRNIEFHAQIFSIGLMSSKDGGNTSSNSSVGSGGGGGGGNNSSRFGSRSGQEWLAVGLENSDIDLVRVSPFVLESGSNGNGNGTASSTTASATTTAVTTTTASSAICPVNSNNNQSASSGSILQPPNEHYRLQLHDNCVLSLRFAHHSDWFVTTSKDHLINAITCPSGINILQTKEAGSVLTSDISADDKYVVTGSGDRKATLYDVIYQNNGGD